MQKYGEGERCGGADSTFHNPEMNKTSSINYQINGGKNQINGNNYGKITMK